MSEFQTQAATEMAMTVLDAMENPDTLRLYDEACQSLSRFAGVLSVAGVPFQQVAGQLHSAASAVIFRGLGIE